MKANEWKALSLFAGAGGCSLGFKYAGIEMIAAFDNANAAIETYNSNFGKGKAKNVDLSSCNFEDIRNELDLKRGELDLIIGGPPCQGFTTAGNRFWDDPRNKLVQNYAQALESFYPRWFMMENVEGILTTAKGIYVVECLKKMIELGYSVYLKKVYLQEQGIPQRRKRVIIVGNREQKEFRYPSPIEIAEGNIYRNCSFTLRDAIEDLEDKERPEIDHIFKKESDIDPAEITQMGADPQGNPSPAEIEKIANKKKEREILLSSASSAFTKAFNEWWKQGDYTFEFQADGDFFRIWVADKIRPERIELEARSTGLQWFFSFYLVFLVESEAHHQNAVLLLDEPGVTLHPLAQKNLFEFFESLGEKNQMIYTTHSPFMVDSDHLERVRSVYVDKNGKTVVSSNLRASEQTHGVNQSQSIYPAHAALGLTVSDTLLINCKPVLVEGESDQLYLSALKNLLISLGKITPLRDLVFIPTGGVKGIKATSSIIASKADERPFVIVDGDIPGQKMKKELLADFYAADADKIIDISDYTSISNGEIEDLFPLERMARIVSKFLPRPEEAEDEFEDIVEDEKPLCNQIEEFAKAQNIPLVRGWKVQLASTIKKEILRGKGKVIKEEDKEFSKVEELFKRILS